MTHPPSKNNYFTTVNGPLCMYFLFSALYTDHLIVGFMFRPTGQIVLCRVDRMLGLDYGDGD